MQIILSFLLFFSCSQVNHDKIAIQPFDGFPDYLCKELSIKINEFYGVEAIVLRSVPLPQNAYYSTRNRYQADSLIFWLKNHIPENYTKIIGLTTRDISHTNGNIPDYGIFGLGYCPGKSCVVSTYRYRKGVSEQLFKDRFFKICLHEIGHNYGLPHCNSVHCLMNDAKGKISTVDQVEMKLCDKCSMKLKILK